MKKNFSAIKGTNMHHKQIVKTVSDLSIKGYYIKITLEHLFINLMLTSRYENHTKKFTAIIVLIENIWDYRINIISHYLPLMIDSESFQYERLYDLLEFNRVKGIKPQNFIDSALPEFQESLEDHSKTRGTFLFKSLPDKILPQRFIFKFPIYEPGQTSGLVLDAETFEFIFPSEESIKLIYRETVYDWLMT